LEASELFLSDGEPKRVQYLKERLTNGNFHFADV
jgi:hypothetical protein